MGKYGTNLEGFGGFEGGVNSEDGAPLVSTSSDGETALLFGPAALREIQAGVANGDFAIPPDEADQTITSENPLPYWTWTPATGITAAIVTDSGSGSGNILRVTVATGTYASDTFGVLSRIVPVATSRARDSVYVPLLSLKSASASQPRFKCTYQYLTQDGTNTGTAMSRVETAVPATIGTVSPNSLANAHTPADAAYLKISISVGVLAGSVAVARTADLCEVRVVSGNPFIYLANRLDPTTAPAVLEVSSGGLESSLPFYTTAGGSEFAELELTGNLIVGTGIAVNSGNVTVVGDSDTSGLMTAGNIASGLVTITPVANTSTGVAVTGLSVLSSNATAGLNDFSVVVSANSAADTVRTTTYSNLTFSGATLTGLTARVFRTNTTATGVSWIVIGR